MHPHFFHWHAKAELKPETLVLAPRWNAAEKFTKETSGLNLCPLLDLALFRKCDPGFCKVFTDYLVKSEPTFPVTNNHELLHVMAGVVVYAHLKSRSSVTDAIALGIQAADFPSGRVSPVSVEITEASASYLIEEAERMRPAISIADQFGALRSHLEGEDWTSDTALLSTAFLDISNAIGRVAEENQFLWWLIGRRSSLLNKPREILTQKEYAFPAAVEAAQRVTQLPNAPSTESMIQDVLAQCLPESNAKKTLAEFLAHATADLKLYGDSSNAMMITPITTRILLKLSGAKPDQTIDLQTQFTSKTKFSPTQLATQYFRELMFLRALSELD